MKPTALIGLVILLGVLTGCSSSAPPKESTGGGIQVVGQWAVTVTDPDGTIASSHEFENDLTSLGKNLLSALLAGATTVKPDEYSLSIFKSSTPYWACEESPSDQPRVISLVGSQMENVEGMPLALAGVCTITGLTGEAKILEVRTHVRVEPWGPYCADLQDNNQVDCGPDGTPVYVFTKHADDIPISNKQKVAFNIKYTFE